MPNGIDKNTGVRKANPISPYLSIAFRTIFCLNVSFSFFLDLSFLGKILKYKSINFWEKKAKNKTPIEPPTKQTDKVCQKENPKPKARGTPSMSLTILVSKTEIILAKEKGI